MKQLLNIIIFMCIGGFIGAWVQMAINPPGVKLYSVAAQQQELVSRGHAIEIDGKFGKNTDLALAKELTK